MWLCSLVKCWEYPMEIKTDERLSSAGTWNAWLVIFQTSVRQIKNNLKIKFWSVLLDVDSFRYWNFKLLSSNSLPKETNIILLHDN